MPGKPEAQVTRPVEVSQAWTSVYCALKGKDRASQVVWTKETQVRSLGQEDPLEEGIANYPRILGWRIPMDRGAWGWGWGVLQSIESHRVRHD